MAVIRHAGKMMYVIYYINILLPYVIYKYMYNTYTYICYTLNIKFVFITYSLYLLLENMYNIYTI